MRRIVYVQCDVIIITLIFRLRLSSRPILTLLSVSWYYSAGETIGQNVGDTIA